MSTKAVGINLANRQVRTPAKRAAQIFLRRQAGVHGVKNFICGKCHEKRQGSGKARRTGANGKISDKNGSDAAPDVPNLHSPPPPPAFNAILAGHAGAPAMNDYPAGMSKHDVQHGDRKMRTVWRFFVEGSGGWSWEQLQTDKTVVQRAERSFEEYDECVADAKRHGYMFEASQAAAPRSMSIRKRS